MFPGWPGLFTAVFQGSRDLRFGCDLRAGGPIFIGSNGRLFPFVLQFDSADLHAVGAGGW